VSAAVVVCYRGLDSTVRGGARVGGLRHVLRNSVPGHQVQEVDHFDDHLLHHVHLLHTAYQGEAKHFILHYSWLDEHQVI